MSTTAHKHSTDATTSTPDQRISYSASPDLRDAGVLADALTETLVEVWPLGTRPKAPSIRRLRVNVKFNRNRPFETLVRFAFAAIDEGKPVGVVTKAFKDLIAAVEHRAAQRAHQLLTGVIPIRQQYARVLTSAILEDGQADARAATVDLDSVESLEKARAERIEAMAKDERLVEFYTARLAQLRARG